MEDTTECKGPVCRIKNKVGKPMGRSGAALQRVYEATEERCGPRPPGYVCRHLCENDSNAPNGFICMIHTEWNTQSVNLLDRSYEAARRFLAGKAAKKLANTCKDSTPSV